MWVDAYGIVFLMEHDGTSAFTSLCAPELICDAQRVTSNNGSMRIQNILMRRDEIVLREKMREIFLTRAHQTSILCSIMPKTSL